MSYGMRWTIYTKVVHTDGCVALRWFWRGPAHDGTRESPFGFVTRGECETDAARFGYQLQELDTHHFRFD